MTQFTAPCGRAKCRFLGSDATDGWASRGSYSTDRIQQQAVNEALDSSSNHLVGANQDRLWNCQPKGLGGPEVDYELEFGRLLDRQVARLGAL